MNLDVSYIVGVNLGFEFIDDEEDGMHYCSIDLFIIRVLFSWEFSDEASV